MVTIIDSLGPYEPNINCTCIDRRTKVNIAHSLALAYERLNSIESNEKRPKDIRQAAQRDLEMVLELKDLFKKIADCP